MKCKCICFDCDLSWYMKAQQIAPKNGRPYNQLAILALYTVSIKFIQNGIKYKNSYAN